MSIHHDDRLVSVLPIHFSNALSPNIQIHQFPLLTRPLQVPPSAAQSGKQIRARIKPKAARLEVHIPVDTRPEVWNQEKGREYGQARAEDDQEKSSELKKAKQPEEHRLSEVRLRSEQVPSKGAYMLGVLRDGRLHLHPISQTHQLRPSLTYMDVLLRKSTRRSRGDDSDPDSDEGPPADPEDPVPPPPTVKKEKKPAGEAKEVTVAVKKADEKGSQSSQGGLTGVRREMLIMMREEDEEKWEDIEYCDGETSESMNAFEAVFSKNDEELHCKSSVIDLLQAIPGL